MTNSVSFQPLILVAKILINSSVSSSFPIQYSMFIFFSINLPQSPGVKNNIALMGHLVGAGSEIRIWMVEYRNWNEAMH